MEYKGAKKPEKLYWTFRIQMFAESLLVRELLKYSTPFAFIKFEQSNDLAKLNVTEKELGEAKETIRRINRAVEAETMPEPTQFQKRCSDCCYRKICRRA